MFIQPLTLAKWHIGCVDCINERVVDFPYPKDPCKDVLAYLTFETFPNGRLERQN
jgi:hypothetical protein